MSQGLYDLIVVDNVPFGDGGFFALRLERPDWKNWNPGQFVMVRPVKWGFDMTWARPLSICRVSANELILFFQVVGRGTKRLADLRSGDHVHVWGPLGTSFVMENEIPTLLLAGGIGIAPFIGYVDRHPTPKYLYLVFGHRQSAEWYPLEFLRKRINVSNYPENKPEDRTQFLNLVRQNISAYALKKGLVLACGPKPFLQFVQKYALDYKVRTQFSIESRMACGVGVCLGCAVKATEKWQDPNKAGFPVQTCTHGPVFWADQINLEE